MTFGKRVAKFDGAASIQPWQTVQHQKSPSLSDDIDFEIDGAEMQFVLLELDPGEAAVAEAGSMMFKDPSIKMETAFGDASHRSQNAGVFDKLVGAGKRLITGESLFFTVFTNEGHRKARVAFAAPYPGHILPLRLDELDNTLICQKDAFLCAARGVSIGIEFQKNIFTGLFGGEGFIMQRLEGGGWAFIHVGGTLVEKKLAPGEELHVDTGCVAAYTSGVGFEITRVGSVKTMLMGGEGLFFASLRGPGTVWIQSLPFTRLAGRLFAEGPAARGGGTGEGSLIGTAADVFTRLR